MAIHDWTRAPTGFFHHFHQAWTCRICDALNSGQLPQGYYALLERTALGVASGGETLLGRTPPSGRRALQGVIALDETMPRTRFVSQSTLAEAEAYAARANRIAVKDAFHEVAAVIEIISPGNKASRNAMNTMVDQAIGLLRQGINLLLIDLFPPTPRDPEGVHQRIWSELTDDVVKSPSNQRLTLASYAVGVPLRAFVEPVAVGDVVPDMPLFVDRSNYVPATLEAPYQVAWHECPEELRQRITDSSTPGSDPEAISP